MLKTRTLSMLALLLSMCGAATAVSAAEPAEAKKLLDSDPHLCGWWRFEETSGTTAKDSSKHGRDAVLPDGLSFDKQSTAGRVGRSLQIDGSPLLVKDYKGIAGTSPRTICVWIRTDTSRGDIVSWGKEEFGQMWILRFIRGRVGVTPHGGYYYMEARVDDGKWHHLAVVVGEADLPNLHDNVKLYLDGKTASVDPIGLLDLWPIETGSEQDVTIGKGYRGAIDELRIYSRALSDEEIETIFRMAQ